MGTENIIVTIHELKVMNDMGIFPYFVKLIPDIIDFKQVRSEDKDNGSRVYIVSIMKFADGTETKAKCEADVNDMYTGFVTCYCKKILGSEFNKTVTYWTEKKPVQDAKEQVKKFKEDEERKAAEQRRIDKAKRKKYKRMVKQKEMEIIAEREIRSRLDGNV